MKKAVIDTGPIVAAFDQNDQWHQRVREFLRDFRGILYSTVAVVTEVCYLLDFDVRAQKDFLEWIARGGLKILDLESEDYLRIRELIAKYRDLPMDFADGSLVALCERIGVQEVVTLDRDFELYRFQKRKKFKNLLEFDHVKVGKKIKRI